MKYRVLTSLSTLFLIVFLNTALSLNVVSAQSTLRITGKVLEKMTNKPLEGVCVATEGKDNFYTKTTADGRFDLEIKGKKAGDAVVLTAISANYSMLYSPLNYTILLSDKGVENVQIDLESEANYVSRDSSFLHYRKIIDKKIKHIASALELLKAPDKRIQTLEDSLSAYQSHIISSENTIMELLISVNNVLNRPLSATAGSLARAKWNEGEIDAAIKLLEEQKVLDTWVSAKKNAAPQTLAAYNDALLLYVLNSIVGNKKNSLQYMKKIALADTTNAEATFAYASELAVALDFETAEKYYILSRRHTMSTGVALLSAQMLDMMQSNKNQFSPRTSATKQSSKWFDFIVESLQNCKKGDAEATAIYKNKTTAIVGLLVALGQKPEHIQKLHELIAANKYKSHDCTLEKFVGDLFAAMNTIYSTKDEEKAIKMLKDVYQATSDCYESSPTFLNAALLTGAMKMQKKLVASKKGYREMELLCKKEIKMYKELIPKNPYQYLPASAKLYNELASFGIDREQKTIVREAIENALPINHQLIALNPFYYSTMYNEGLMEVLDKVEGENGWKEGVLKKELAYFEPLLTEKSMDYGSVVSKLYMSYAMLLQQDSTRKAEIADFYQKDIALIDRAILVNEPKYTYSLVAVYSRAVDYFTENKEYQKSENLLQKAIIQTKKLYLTDKKEEWSGYLNAELNLLDFYKNQVCREKNPGYRKSAATHLTEIEKVLQEENLLEKPAASKEKKTPKKESDDDYDYDNSWKYDYVNTYNDLKDFFEKVSIDDALLIGKLDSLDILIGETNKETEHAKLATLYQEKVVLLNKLEKNSKIENNYIQSQARAQGGLAWHLLFVGKYAEAQAAAEKGLNANLPKEQKPNLEWINSNLALAYLLQGKYSDAMKIYKKFKGKDFSTDKTWVEAFLADIDELEAAKITHNDFEKVRKYLNK